MKIGVIEKIQHLNAMLTFLFCVVYSFLQHDVVLGLFAWACSLPFLYFANLITSPNWSKEDAKTGKKMWIIASWCLIFFFLWIPWGDNLLKYAFIISFVILIVAFCILVLRGRRQA